MDGVYSTRAVKAYGYTNKLDTKRARKEIMLEQVQTSIQPDELDGARDLLNIEAHGDYHHLLWHGKRIASYVLTPLQDAHLFWRELGNPVIRKVWLLEVMDSRAGRKVLKKVLT